jgi:hypothetical protein
MVVAWPEPPPPRAKRSPPRHPGGLKSSAPRAYSLVQDGATPQRQRILCHTMCGMGIFVIAAGKNQRSTQPSALSVTGKGHKKNTNIASCFLGSRSQNCNLGPPGCAVRQSFFFLKMKKWLLSGSHVKANMMTCTNLTK